MKRSKPVKSLLALILAAAAAVTGWHGWKSWRRWLGRDQAALTPGDAQPPSAAVATADATTPIASLPTPATPPSAEADVAALAHATPTSVAEDEASASRADDAGPEPAGEIADSLPDPDLVVTELGDEMPLTADDGVDRVLEVLAAEADAQEPSKIQSRFGPNAVAADEGGDCPPNHPVKGNANSMIFHLPGQSSYGATMAEVCFSDSVAAEAAGFRPRKR